MSGRIPACSSGREVRGPREGSFRSWDQWPSGPCRASGPIACSGSSRGVTRPARTSAARAVASWRAHSSQDITVMAAPPGWWKRYYQGGTGWEGRTVIVNPLHPPSRVTSTSPPGPCPHTARVGWRVQLGARPLTLSTLCLPARCRGHMGEKVLSTEIAAFSTLKPLRRTSLSAASSAERPERRKSPFDRSRPTI
jgi:hypothetical protein